MDKDRFEGNYSRASIKIAEEINRVLSLLQFNSAGIATNFHDIHWHMRNSSQEVAVVDGREEIVSGGVRAELDQLFSILDPGSHLLREFSQVLKVCLPGITNGTFELRVIGPSHVAGVMEENYGVSLYLYGTVFGNSLEYYISIRVNHLTAIAIMHIIRANDSIVYMKDRLQVYRQLKQSKPPFRWFEIIITRGNERSRFRGQ